MAVLFHFMVKFVVCPGDPLAALSLRASGVPVGEKYIDASSESSKCKLNIFSVPYQG